MFIYLGSFMLNFSSSPFPTARICTVLALLLLVMRLTAAAQAPAWQSARAVATATAAVLGNSSVVAATAVDAAGNVYLAGSFRNTVVMGSTTLTSLGEYDVFVAKFNPASNQFVWAQRAGGTNNDYATALAVSGTSVYVAGDFSSPTAGFALTTLSNSTGFRDVFVAKLTDAGSTGSFLWAQQAGGTRDDAATALAVSGTHVYVAGYFCSSTAGFGATTLSNPTNSTINPTPDVFVAKLTDAGPTGSFDWVQRAGGTNSDEATALVVNGLNVYVAGYFASTTAGFGSITLTNAGTMTGYSNVFVAKLTDAGSFVWVRQADGGGASALAMSGTDLYVAGSFYSPTTSFGATTLTNAGANAGTNDVFVAKLTDAGNTGNFVWAQRAGGTASDYARALAVSGTSVYVAGHFYSFTAGFGATTLTNSTSISANDMFVAKLLDAGSTGSFMWAQRAGGTGSDYAYALVVSGTSVLVSGYLTSPTASFGAITITNSNSGIPLGFFASLTDPTLTATATAGSREPAALFPNPARGTATLRLPAGTPGAPLTLTDALGRAVRRYPAPAAPETALDLGGLPAGLYLLRGAGPARRLAVE